MIDLLKLLWIAAPEIRISGQVENQVASRHRFPDRLRVAQIADGDFDTAVGEMRCGRLRPFEDPHRLVLGHELFH